MDIRFTSVAVLLVLSTCVSAQAQTSALNPATASPYALTKRKGYTSFDNPYAPGGIYDPYRGVTGQQDGIRRKSKAKLLQSNGLDSMTSNDSGFLAGVQSSAPGVGGGCKGRGFSSSAGGYGAGRGNGGRKGRNSPGNGYSGLSQCGQSTLAGRGLNSPTLGGRNMGSGSLTGRGGTGLMQSHQGQHTQR